MFSEIIQVNATYDKTYSFFLQMIGIAEEEQLTQKLLGVKEDEKAEQEYLIAVQIISELADRTGKMPLGLFPNKPEEVDKNDSSVYLENFNKPSEAVNAFFSEKTVGRERLARYVFRSYLVRLQPAESFFIQ
jgi:hypothetical protein